MASDVDICNLALSFLGDDASISSISPPESSIQSLYCSRFYPIARNSLLELHNWSFASKREVLSQVENNNMQWSYAYALPADMMKAISVLPQNFGIEYTDLVPYIIEQNDETIDILFTNQTDALLRYQSYVNDPNKFSALFQISLAWHLASMLAGVIIKGDEGQAQSKRCAQMMTLFMYQAANQDSAQRNINVRATHLPSWISGR